MQAFCCAATQLFITPPAEMFAERAERWLQRLFDPSMTSSQDKKPKKSKADELLKSRLTSSPTPMLTHVSFPERKRPLHLAANKKKNAMQQQEENCSVMVYNCDPDSCF